MARVDGYGWGVNSDIMYLAEETFVRNISFLNKTMLL